MYNKEHWYQYRFTYSPKAVKRICITCNKAFYLIPSNIKRGKGRFCSLQCYKDFRSKRIVTNNNSTKICSTCGQKNNISEYLNRKDTKDRLSPQCTECRKITVLQSKYHLSKAEARFYYHKQQNDKCDCCGLSAKDNLHKCGNSLHIDHDHKTGKIRGILCLSCNLLLGRLDDSVDYLYLKIFKRYIKTKSVN